MQSAEIELKFPIADLHGYSRRFQRLASGSTHPAPSSRIRSTTRHRAHCGIEADTPRAQLRGCMDGDAQAARAERSHGGRDRAPAPRYKVRIETETTVEDGPAVSAIFEQLGYAPVFRYEKFRTEWSQGTGSIAGPLFTAEIPALPARSHLVIDETPIGDFAELEGAPAWIDATLEKLGIDPATCITESYGRLFLAWKERTRSAAENLTFDEIPATEMAQA